MTKMPPEIHSWLDFMADPRPASMQLHVSPRDAAYSDRNPTTYDSGVSTELGNKPTELPNSPATWFGPYPEMTAPIEQSPLQALTEGLQRGATGAGWREMFGKEDDSNYMNSWNVSKLNSIARVLGENIADPVNYLGGFVAKTGAKLIPKSGLEYLRRMLVKAVPAAEGSALHALPVTHEELAKIYPGLNSSQQEGLREVMDKLVANKGTVLGMYSPQKELKGAYALSDAVDPLLGKVKNIDMQVGWDKDFTRRAAQAARLNPDLQGSVFRAQPFHDAKLVDYYKDIGMPFRSRKNYADDIVFKAQGGSVQAPKNMQEWYDIFEKETA